MARIDDAQKTLRMLAAHSETILEAHLTQGNRVPETPENEHLLGLLKHHRLILSIGDEEPQLKKVLIQFLGHITESDRRRWASQHIDKVWLELVELFEQYHEAKAKVAISDQERLEDEIKEILSGLIEDIRIATETFSAHISSGFSYVTDLDLRIRENERVIERAGRLLTLFESFNVLELADRAGGDPFLKRLLLKYLPATLEEGRQNLSYALNQLRVLLVRLREDQRMNKLVGSFEAYFQKNPGFMPSIDHLDLNGCPVTLNSVSPFHMAASPDLSESSDSAELIELAATARAKDTEPAPKTQQESIAENIEFNADSEIVEEEDDEVEALIEALLQHILGTEEDIGTIRASDVLAASGLDIDLATWLATLAAEIDSLPTSDRASMEVVFQSSPDPIYQGNLYIHDMSVRRSSVGSRI